MGRGELLQDCFGFFTCINHQQDEVGKKDFIKGRLECIDKPVRKLLYKSHGIRQKCFSSSQVKRPGCRNKGCKKHVPGFNAFINNRIEKCAFSGIGVTCKSDKGKAFPVPKSPERLVIFSCRLEFIFDPGYPFLQVLLVGVFIVPKPHKTCSFLFFHKGNNSSRSWNFIFQPGKFNLEFGTACSSSFCKNLQDKLEFVHYLAPADFRDVEKLNCGKPVIENYLSGPLLPHKFGKFLYLSFPELIP
ncbi:hypothetical protein DSECCO2_636310 [anaerobic digester metagenome]